jgi:S-adenosylmethionine-diacylglycerol 3-amino-3-carboxypropyl transferase
MSLPDLSPPGAWNPMAGEGWLDHAAAAPLRSAQVHEDPRTDAWVAEQLTPGSRGLILAGGGCTACFLAAQGRFRTLVLVDPDPAQLALTRLKLGWLEALRPEQRMALLGHRPMEPGVRAKALRDELEQRGLAPDVFGVPDQVAVLGLDHAGRYERLLTRLGHVLGWVMGAGELLGQLLVLDRPDRQRIFLDQHPELLEALAAALEEVMTPAVLARLFGPVAANRPERPFPQYFHHQLVRALRAFPAANNPFLAQFLAGRTRTPAPLPWLTLARQPIRTDLAFVQATLDAALAQDSEPLDFIDLSNALDGLEWDQARDLLDRAAARLAPGGWLVVRQLNSALPVPRLGRGIRWRPEASRALYAWDRSFLCTRLHAGSPG